MEPSLTVGLLPRLAILLQDRACQVAALLQSVHKLPRRKGAKIELEL